MDTNLLIGIIESDQQLKDTSNELICFRTNKIGGRPLLSPKTADHMVRAIDSLVCDLCQKCLTFVLQIYCPVDDSSADRILYLFVCINSDCNQNKWFAIRSVTPFFEANGVKQDICEANDWIEGQEDWGQTEEEEMRENVFECTESLANLSVATDSSQMKDSIVCQTSDYFKTFFVSVIEEPMDSMKDDKHINHLMETYEQNNENMNSSKAVNNSNECYEQNFLDTIYRNDRKNYEFFKRLSICPKQIIRYEWMGKPLINSDLHKPMVSVCELCGADRCFELQLMPALISYLKPLSDTDSEVGVDFGTVLIFSCSKNCLKSNSLSVEQTIVLSDPDNQFTDKIHQ